MLSDQCTFRHAQYSLGDFKAAADAFSRGLKLEPNNSGLKAALKNSQDRIVPSDEDGPPPLIPDDRSIPETSSSPGGGMAGMADMLRGIGGGGGGGGGMPDLAGLMNNPQMMAMAQQLAANGGLERYASRFITLCVSNLFRLMSNPGVADMVCELPTSCNY